MAKFTKKPDVVEAFQFHKGQVQPELSKFIGNHPNKRGSHVSYDEGRETISVNGPRGVTRAVDGDWIVVGVDNVITVLKEDAFKAQYAQASDQHEDPPKATGEDQGQGGQIVPVEDRPV